MILWSKQHLLLTKIINLHRYLWGQSVCQHFSIYAIILPISHFLHSFDQANFANNLNKCNLKCNMVASTVSVKSHFAGFLKQEFADYFKITKPKLYLNHFALIVSEHQAWGTGSMKHSAKILWTTLLSI